MATKHQSKISVGDYVRFNRGVYVAQGIVLEDRGALGIGGTHLYRIRFSTDPYTEDMEFEMPEDLLEVIDAAEFHGKPISPREAKEYLEREGLIDILRAGMPGGKSQPCAWLRRNDLGNVVHTFSSQMGAIGGWGVPFGALYGNRIFRPKREEVLSFLKSFGLSEEDAEHVINTIGMAP